MTHPDDSLLTIHAVAERLGQSEQTVRRKIAAGVLPALRLGDGLKAPLRVDTRELEAWLHANPDTP